MFTDYLQPIDSDLNTLECNYEVPTDNTTPIFAFRQEDAYKKIIELPIQKQKVSISQHFVDNPFLEIKGNVDSKFKVQFFDGNGSITYENIINSNTWIKLNRTYFTNWTTKVWEGNEMIYANYLHLHNKRVFIVIESKSLGDTLAWVPYALEFQKLHQCKVILSTFWNRILHYPELELVEPGIVVNNVYALYRIGWFYNSDKEPEIPNTIPLQKAATNILGLDFTEQRPVLAYTPVKFESAGKFVTIATNSTSGCKFWTKEGWQELINYLVSQNYLVYNVSKEKNPFDNCVQIEDTSIENTINMISNSKFFIGLSSGLSWLAWALNVKVFMISNFTEADHEFTDCVRITNTNVCHGCWNEEGIIFDKGDWNWCKHKDTDKHFECHKSITAQMVIEKIKAAF
jgi:autotransporter strand-loop-strand O-heptosyltransferase